MNELQNRKRRVRRWMAAVLLSLCLILTLLPVEYYGFSIPQTNNVPVTAQQEILSFSELPSDVILQNAAIGTPIESLYLPNQLTAVCHSLRENPSNTETTETLDTETTETINTEETETPNTETTETPNTEMPETPNTETTETPNTEIPENPNTETPETPETETTPESDSNPSENENSEIPEPTAPASDETYANTAETTTVKPIETDTPKESSQNNISDEPASAETTTVTIKKNYAAPVNTPEIKEISLQETDSAAETIVIEGILWNSSPEYDSETEGTYQFTPILPVGFSLAENVTLPLITVTVSSSETEIMLLEEASSTEMPPSTKPEFGTIQTDTVWEAGVLDSENGELIIESGVTLTLTGSLEIKGNVTISGGGKMVRGTAEALLSANSANLSLSGVTLDGCSIPSNYSMIESNSGKITLNDNCKIINCIKNTQHTTSRTTSGAALFLERGTAVFNQAEITNCSSDYQGGAIHIKDSTVTIHNGTYSNNKTTAADPQNPRGGGFIYNEASTLIINNGNFLENTSTGKGGCIYHGGTNNTKTQIYGGYFHGNKSTYPGYEGSGAIYNSAVDTASTELTLSGSVHFSGDENPSSGTDGIYLDYKDTNKTFRKIYISGTLVYPVKMYLNAKTAAEYGYAIAEGDGYTLLEERDMKKITFVDTGNSGKEWYAILDSAANQVKISEIKPDYKLYVTYIPNGAQGTVKDENGYVSGADVTIKSADGLTREGYFFAGWNTAADGSGTFYYPNQTYPITDDLDLYAYFVNKISATFYSGGANQFETKEASVPDLAVTTPNLKPMEGFTAVGWSESPDTYTGNIAENTQQTLQKDTSYYGIYKKDVTLSYDMQGVTENPKAVTTPILANVHDIITYEYPQFELNSTAIRPGYTFLGWTKDPDGNGELYPPKSTQTFESDTTLYANWKANDDTPYIVEHYQQNVTGTEYIKVDSDTQNLTAKTGTPVTAEPKTYTGFTENTTHPLRKASGTVTENGSLVLKLYYDRDAYEVSFDLNGADGTPPAAQHILYGNQVSQPADPDRTGYHFKGWYTDEECSDENKWDFTQKIEEYTESHSVTLYAKWLDDIAPILGEVSFNEGYKNFWNQIIRKKSLIITIPITEEGSGLKQVDYILNSEEKNARLSSAKTAKFENLGDGLYLANIVIEEDFKGTVTLTATDCAKIPNTSPQKSVTAENGKIIVEDNAPEIRFSTENGTIPDYFFDSAKINVIVEDENTSVEGSKISGGLSDIVYQIDDGDKINASDKSFEDTLVTTCLFDVVIPETGTHTLRVTAADNAGNRNTQQISITIQKQQQTYKTEHYTQNLDGITYTKEIADTREQIETVGTIVTATPNTYTGFIENTTIKSRVPSGTVDKTGSLVLKLYYDREIYDIHYDLNGGDGTAPQNQTARYGALLEPVPEPSRKGYVFKGWYKDANGTDGSQWNFEKDTADSSITLYAKWADEIPPVLGDTTYHTAYKNILNWIIQKPSLIMTVPITEEGSGLKQADYTLTSKGRSATNAKADIETVHGQTTAKISINNDFKGTITLKASDNAGNISADKIITTSENGVIVEDGAPEIRFSSKTGTLSEPFYQEADIDVSITDIENASGISSGIAAVSYRIDDKEETNMPKEDFSSDIVESYPFTVHISNEGNHSVSVKAIDNAGNETLRQIDINIKEPEIQPPEEPKKEPPEEPKIEPSEEPETQPPKTPKAKKVPIKEPKKEPEKPAAAQNPPTPQSSNEPKTGDSSKVELYATIAMISGLLYLLLLFSAGTKDKPKEKD